MKLKTIVSLILVFLRHMWQKMDIIFIQEKIRSLGRYPERKLELTPFFSKI